MGWLLRTHTSYELHSSSDGVIKKRVLNCVERSYKLSFGLKPSADSVIELLLFEEGFRMVRMEINLFGSHSSLRWEAHFFEQM